MTSVDVVVLTWNDEADMRTAVESIRSSRGVETSIIVVDNGSLTPVHDVEGASVIRSSENLGVGGGRNHGAAQGTAEFVCFLDSDARLAPDCLAQLVAAVDDGVGLTAPVFAGQPPATSAGDRPSLARKVTRGLGLTDEYGRSTEQIGGAWAVDFAIGACQLVRRDAFEQVGGFTTDDLFGPEDVELCDDLRGSGWEIRQVAGAVCHHQARRSHRRIFSRRGLRHGRALLRYYTKRRRRAS